LLPEDGPGRQYHATTLDQARKWSFQLTKFQSGEGMVI
jgi:hypothetical protein